MTVICRKGTLMTSRCASRRIKRYPDLCLCLKSRQHKLLSGEKWAHSTDRGRGQLIEKWVGEGTCGCDCLPALCLFPGVARWASSWAGGRCECGTCTTCASCTASSKRVWSGTTSQPHSVTCASSCIIQAACFSCLGAFVSLYRYRRMLGAFVSLVLITRG